MAAKYYVYITTCLCKIYTFFLARCSRRPFFFPCTFDGASKGAIGTLRCMSESRPSSVAVLWAFKVAELALFVKGLCPASLSKIRRMENPSFGLIFFGALGIRSR